MRAIDQLLASRWVRERGVRAHDIDAVIFCGVSRQHTEPATATLIHRRLGLYSALAYDISNACLGFVDGICSADAMLAAGQCELALVVTAERLTPIRDRALLAIAGGADPNAHLASITLGDGAAACLLERKARVANADGVIAGARASYGQFSDLCVLPIDAGPMITRSKELFSAALAHYPAVVAPVLEASGWTVDDVDVVVTHQASKRSIVQGCLQIGIDPGKALYSVAEFGNLASAAVPYTLSRALSDGAVRRGQRVLLVGLGSGIGISALTLTV
jgi:3-oxoacyl-[acyl-carrier-protein] synthase-3